MYYNQKQIIVQTKIAGNRGLLPKYADVFKVDFIVPYINCKITHKALII